MTHEKNDQAMSLQVTEGLTVTILPDSNHEFIMSTRQVAAGYGICETTIRRHRQNYKEELIDGKHFFNGVQNLNGAKLPVTYWTKRGIVRLGFFIKSERAKMFRDWAEELVLTQLEKPRAKQLPTKVKHNRLTAERMVDILMDVALIDDREIRTNIVRKLTTL